MVKTNTYKIVDLYSDIKRNIKRYLEVSILTDIDREVNLFSVLNDNKIGSFFDKIINKTNNYFIRVVNNTTYHIKNSKLFFIFEQLFPKEFITRLKKNQKFNLNIMTLDVETFLQIETYLDKNNQKKERKIMNIYCISYFDGNKAKSFYISDYSSIDKLINAVLRDIFRQEIILEIGMQ